jgi:hypothetical protein
MNIGDRVGAVQSIKESVMYLFGYGVFEGDQVPHTNDVKFFGLSLKEYNRKNPCILLDSGERIYGCECWRGTEKEIKEYEEECREVIIVTPEEHRKLDE